MTIHLQNFNVWYGTTQILHDITASYKPNIISAIIGSSGCGKTTLLKSMNRTAELSPTFRHTGQVRLQDTDLYQETNPTIIRRTIGMVFQKPIVLPLTIAENVLFGPRYYGIQDKQELALILENCLQQVGLWHEVKDKLHGSAKQLSGGQQQRLAIARVLAVNPKLLLLDEPCSSLDIMSTRVIEELLQQLATTLTIIIVTHNLSQAKRIATETFFMNHGQLIEANTTEELFAHPRQQQTQLFLAE